MRKSITQQIRSRDKLTLLEHIYISLRIHKCIEDNLNSSKRNKKKTNLFFKNYGVFSKEVISNQELEEEIYISDELINPDEFVSLSEVLRNNGGLLSIPELAVTDTAFYIVRYWGKKILKILSNLHKMNVCIKYLSLDDIMISRNGEKIKLKKLMHFSQFDQRKQGKV